MLRIAPTSEQKENMMRFLDYQRKSTTKAEPYLALPSILNDRSLALVESLLIESSALSVYISTQVEYALGP